MSSTPLAQLLPPLARNQSIIIILLPPDVVTLDVRLVALGVCAPFADLIRDSLRAQLRELGLDAVQSGSWKIPLHCQLPDTHYYYLGTWVDHLQEITRCRLVSVVYVFARGSRRVMCP